MTDKEKTLNGIEKLKAQLATRKKANLEFENARKLYFTKELTRDEELMGYTPETKSITFAAYANNFAFGAQYFPSIDQFNVLFHMAGKVLSDEQIKKFNSSPECNTNYREIIHYHEGTFEEPENAPYEFIDSLREDHEHKILSKYLNEAGEIRANIIRERWGLGNKRLDNLRLRYILLQNKILLIPRDLSSFSKDLKSFSRFMVDIHNKLLGACIIYEESLSHTEENYWIAYELGNILFQFDNDLERALNSQFALAFLVPRGKLIEKINVHNKNPDDLSNINKEAFESIAQYFGIDDSMLLNRLRKYLGRLNARERLKIKL